MKRIQAHVQTMLTDPKPNAQNSSRHFAVWTAGRGVFGGGTFGEGLAAFLGLLGTGGEAQRGGGKGKQKSGIRAVHDKYSLAYSQMLTIIGRAGFPPPMRPLAQPTRGESSKLAKCRCGT